MFFLLESTLFPLLFTAVLGYSADKFVVSMIFGAVVGIIMDISYWKNSVFTLRVTRGREYFKVLFALIPLTVAFVLLSLSPEIMGISSKTIVSTGLTSLNANKSELIKRAYASVIVMMFSASGIIVIRFLLYPLIERFCSLLGISRTGKFKAVLLMLLFAVMIPISLLKGLFMGILNSVVTYVKSFKENVI